MKHNAGILGISRLLLVGLLLVICWTQVFAQAPDYDLFGTEAPLKVRLEFDQKQLVRKKYKDDYHEAVFTYTLEDGTSRTEAIRIRARGEFRKKHCSFPPLTLNFKQVEDDDRVFSAFNKLKLVTHCKETEIYQQYLYKEFLIYKMYNQLTDYSFRVRLLEITYVNSKDPSDSSLHYGFLIESIKELAERHDSFELEVADIHPTLTDPRYMNLVDVFQFMIGNTDFSVYHLHNIKLLKFNDFRKERPVSVPYDFDYSGMVNAHYAIPDPVLGIKKVRERVFWGYCQTEDLFELNYRIFQEKRAQLYAVINDFPLLDTREKRSMSSYLDSFYEIIDAPASRQRELLKACRTP